MGLSWVFHSLITIVFGNPDNQGLHNEDPNDEGSSEVKIIKCSTPTPKMDEYFQMPLHYPRFKKEDYEKMEEWKVDILLREYGLINSFVEGSQGGGISTTTSTLDEKRAFAMGAFLWPDQI